MADKVTLGYWGTRGRAQVSRLLLAYTGAVWEDVKYTDPNAWFGKDKTGLGLQFPNLPYLIDGDFKVTQTVAINRYIIGRSNKKDLLGKDVKDHAKMNMVLGVLNDIFTTYLPLAFNPDWEKAKDEAFKKVQPKFDYLKSFYKDRDWALGYISLADFVLTETTYYFEKINPEQYKHYQFLHKVRHNFESLPEIKSYYEQPTAVKGPFLPQSAFIKF